MVRPSRMGQWAEQQAAQLLQQAGFTVIDQNFHSHYGEIDIIACDHQNSELIFTEVKARSATRHGSAIETITAAKQRKIIRTALSFVEKNPDFHDLYYRFDIICFDFHREFAKNVQHDFSKYPYDQQWIENAFTLDAELFNL
ncbi:YraN family protein [Acinetobacter sp. WZC-1]|uniref:YraN family protein n=1 Tax=Acinetobacter sp. WZC-1 TaxID=3459034 RepID=UPI00403DF41F